jgi:hypothetical protein
MRNTVLWNFMIEQKEKEKNKTNLIFIHTPKCGGSYVSHICRDLNITNKGHNQAEKNEGITFTIIRNPIERFESLLNYRLDEKTPRGDWPRQLDYVYNDTNITLNEIVSKMSDNDITMFTPYNSLTYWSKNVDILITIDQLHEFLHFFGYNYNPNDYKKKNVSNKLRGKLNNETKDRIAKLYYDDIVLFNTVINSYC